MQRRNIGKRSLDDFPTPKWATRALVEKLQKRGENLARATAWEPCCNRGHMAMPMREVFASVRATDIKDYGWSGMDAQQDFLFGNVAEMSVDWIFMNPPFTLGLKFILRALVIARRGVALFVRTAFVEGQERYKDLFARTPESVFMPFVERVVLWKGVLLDPEVPIQRWNAKKEQYVTEKPTSATSYCWLVFERGFQGDGCISRIAPCRRRLTRPGDYPPLPEDLQPTPPPEARGGLL